MRDGLKERCITRDLKWGIPVPLDGYRDKVFYVWFDAPIGYISITAGLTADWAAWWQKPDDVELFQFIGKDNIPFHTVIFPSSLLGDGRPWTLLHHMSSTESLNYEGGKFSKSRGFGIFGNDILETGIPADVWRFYVYYNRPEKSDAQFTWSDFQEKVNGELIGNLGNLVNRTLSFIARFYDGRVPEGPMDPEFEAEVRRMEGEISDCLERAELRDAFRKLFELSSLGNKAFQAGEPWKERLREPAKAAGLLKSLCYLLKDIAIIAQPFLPASSAKLAGFLGVKVGQGAADWSQLGLREGLGAVKAPEMLFQKLEDEQISAFRERFKGTQAEREAEAGETAQGTKPANMGKEPSAKEAAPSPVPPAADPEAAFNALIDLRVATILKVERHPKAEKLYIETLDDGSGTERVIVSGLVPHYAAEELLGKHVVLAYNLKPAKLRGVESRGMLLAASAPDAQGGETVEVLEAPWAAPGTRLTLEDLPIPDSGLPQIDIDTFFSVPIRAVKGQIMVGGRRLCAAGRPIAQSRVTEGSVG
jgi:methionyl-tRNA synthetase